MNYFTKHQINDHIWQFKDPMGVLVTLIIGKEKAMLVDTAYGIGNLKGLVKSITDKELIVVATHGHMDHTGGNYTFDKVYIHKDDVALCTKHNSLAWRKRNINNATNLNLLSDDFDVDTYLTKDQGNLVLLEENQTFDLGGITTTIIPMPGHTTGSIGILLNEDRILITSDAACPFVWLFLEESTTVSTYVKMLEHVLTLPYDYILLGHGKGELINGKRMIDFYNIANTIDLEKSVQVYFNNFDHLTSYCFTHHKMYDQSGCGIVFDPNKM